MSKMIHFEIPSENPEKAISFFETVFGWKAQRFMNADYWTIVAGENDEPGINGAIMKKNHPNQPFTSHINVTSIDETLQKIEAAGGTVVVPKSPIPDMGWYAFFKDLDGNILGVHAFDPTAK